MEHGLGSGAERRRDHRYGLDCKVRYRFLDGRLPGYWEATSRDISRHGIRLWSERKIPCGSRVEIFMRGPDGRSAVRGVVRAVRCTEHPLNDEAYNYYYNPETMVDYEVGCRSAGSALFHELRDIPWSVTGH